MGQKIRSEKEEITLSAKISIFGLALLLGLVEQGASTLVELLELGNSRMGMAGAIRKGLKTRSLWDYHGELKELEKNSARTILWRLQKKGLVEKKKDHYRPTLLGLNLVKNFQEKKSEKQWDGKWRIVMFDVPEKMRAERNWLRTQLFNFKYKLLQKSVFIGKQPLGEDFFKEITDKKLHQYIRLLTAGEIDDEKDLNV